MKKSLLFIITLLILIGSVLYIEFYIFDLQQTKAAIEKKTVVYQLPEEDSEVD